MKNIKYLLFISICLILLSFFYSLIISPTISITNNTDRTIKVTKGEFKDYKSDPEWDEVEDMFNNIVLVSPKSSHSYNISSKTITSKDDIRIDVSYEQGEKTYGESFKISNNGFCRYKINVYDGLYFIETSKFNICYKKLKLVN